MTSIDKKEILFRARDVLFEIDSYAELAQVLEAKLYSGPSPSPIRLREGGYIPGREEELIEKINACIARLRSERNAASDLVQKAVDIINAVKGGKKRAALRYYFLCGRSAAKIAVLLDCDEKTVRRWVENPLF